MGWQITWTENTLIISEACAKELYKVGKHEYYFEEEDEEEALTQVYDPETGLIQFNCDHMEHQDFLYRDEMQAVLIKHKAKGRVLWTSADGDNCGANWGYEFDGEGGWKLLKAVLTWVEDDKHEEEE